MSVTFPENGDFFTGQSAPGGVITFRGTVTPGSQVVANTFVATVSGDTWSIVLVLQDGPNSVEIVATNPGGSTTTSIVVSYQAFVGSPL